MSNRCRQENILRVLGLAALLLLTGCMPALPSYEWDGADAALEPVARCYFWQALLSPATAQMNRRWAKVPATFASWR